MPVRLWRTRCERGSPCSSSEDAPSSLDGGSRTDPFKPTAHVWKRFPVKLGFERCRYRVAGDIRECEGATRKERLVSEPAIGVLVHGERAFVEPMNGVPVSCRRIAAQDECL